MQQFLVTEESSQHATYSRSQLTAKGHIITELPTEVPTMQMHGAPNTSSECEKTFFVVVNFWLSLYGPFS